MVNFLSMQMIFTLSWGLLLEYLKNSNNDQS